MCADELPRAADGIGRIGHMWLVAVMLLQITFFSHGAPAPRVRQSFVLDWRFHMGDVPEATNADFTDPAWRVLNRAARLQRGGGFFDDEFQLHGLSAGRNRVVSEKVLRAGGMAGQNGQHAV